MGRSRWFRVVVAAGVATASTYVGLTQSASAATRDGVCEWGEVCGFKHSGYDSSFTFDVPGGDQNYSGDNYIGWWNQPANDNHSSLQQKRSGTYKFCKHANGTACFLLPYGYSDSNLADSSGSAPPGFNDQLSYHWVA